MKRIPSSRRIRTVIVVIFGLLPAISGGEAQPAEGKGTGDSAADLRAAIEKEPGLSPELKAAMLKAFGDIEESRKETSAWTKILSRLSLYGDFRYRHETNFELIDRPTQNRERIRLRFGANYQVHPAVTVGARLVTGNPADPKSPHQTLGQEFNKFDISLDRAFVTFAPKAAPSLAITGGKFGHAFWQNPVYGELVWDADVQPTGGMASYDFARLLDPDKPAWLQSIKVALGEYLITEKGLSDEASAFVAQGSVSVRPAEKLTATAAVGYYRYSDLTPDGAQDLFLKNSGNATADRNGNGTADDFASRFEIVNPIAAITWTGLPVPVTVSGEYMKNLRAFDDHDSGYALGAAVGKTDRQGDFRIYYQWQALETDSVFSGFSQDDFLRSTNLRAHLAGAWYQVLDPVGLHAWFLISRADDPAPGASSAYEWRFRFDINVKF